MYKTPILIPELHVLSVVVHTCNPCSQAEETEGLKAQSHFDISLDKYMVWGKSGLHEIISNETRN